MHSDDSIRQECSDAEAETGFHWLCFMVLSLEAVTLITMHTMTRCVGKVCLYTSPRACLSYSPLSHASSQSLKGPGIAL